jgi:hypothetical protein
MNVVVGGVGRRGGTVKGMSAGIDGGRLVRKIVGYTQCGGVGGVPVGRNVGRHKRVLRLVEDWGKCGITIQPLSI